MTSDQSVLAGEIAVAINHTRPAKAMGSDDIAPIKLEHLAPKAHAYIAQTFTMSFNTGAISNLWKTSRITPLSKTEKSQLFQKLSSILTAVTVSLTFGVSPPSANKEFNKLADRQQRFRKLRFTTSVIYERLRIRKGLNSKKPAQRTVVIILDICAAFGTVNNNKLLSRIQKEVPPAIKRRLYTYLCVRQSYIEFTSSKS